jgi:hypothetical protein
MARYVAAILCFVSVFALCAEGRKTGLEPVSIPEGTILTFHLQTRLDPADGNALDSLPKGTLLQVKILDAIDSRVNRDGFSFRGELVAPVLSGQQVVVHPEAEVTGILALLRSKVHPEGFRYELLVTKLNDHGKTYDLTASINPSFADNTASSAPAVVSPEK